MPARWQKFFNDVADAFWLLPALLVASGALLALGLADAEQNGLVPASILRWTYGGGDSGARILLGAIASSSITVAGTLFSITIAALSLASTQMGPRLLGSFMRDRGNQVTLGVLLATFAYALVLLRTVRGGETVFVPQLALSIGVGLALACIWAVIYFVHHVAIRINVDTVIDIVHHDLERGIEKLARTSEGGDLAAPSWEGSSWVRSTDSGYLQQVDEAALTDWAAGRGVVVQLLVRPGSYVFPQGYVARVAPTTPDAHQAVRDALVLGRRPASFADLEFTVNQLVEVAARALSPGINDPLTANRVLDRFGSSLCRLAERHMPAETVGRDGRPLLVRHPVTYPGLTSAMFDIIRQNAAGQPAVLIHMVDVLHDVVLCERDGARLAVLSREAGLVIADGRRAFGNPTDIAELEAHYARFAKAAQEGAPDV